MAFSEWCETAPEGLARMLLPAILAKTLCIMIARLTNENFDRMDNIMTALIKFEEIETESEQDTEKDKNSDLYEIQEKFLILRHYRALQTEMH